MSATVSPPQAWVPAQDAEHHAPPHDAHPLTPGWTPSTRSLAQSGTENSGSQSQEKRRGSLGGDATGGRRGSLSGDTTGGPMPLLLHSAYNQSLAGLSPGISPGASLSPGQAALLASSVAVVVPGVLYVSSFRDLHDHDAVRAAAIVAFLCVAADVAPPAYITDDDLRNGRVAFQHMPLADSGATRLGDHLPAAFAFIDAARAEGRPVAVYCQAGKSRSVSVVAAYLMREEQIDFGAAMERIRRTRPGADPNIAFCMQLQELTDALHGGGYGGFQGPVTPVPRVLPTFLAGDMGSTNTALSHTFSNTFSNTFASFSGSPRTLQHANASDGFSLRISADNSFAVAAADARSAAAAEALRRPVLRTTPSAAVLQALTDELLPLLTPPERRLTLPMTTATASATLRPPAAALQIEGQ
jgi:predicted protein tyrosine phosphatase